MPLTLEQQAAAAHLQQPISLNIFPSPVFATPGNDPLTHTLCCLHPKKLNCFHPGNAGPSKMPQAAVPVLLLALLAILAVDAHAAPLSDNHGDKGGGPTFTYQPISAAVAVDPTRRTYRLQARQGWGDPSVRYVTVLQPVGTAVLQPTGAAAAAAAPNMVLVPAGAWGRCGLEDTARMWGKDGEARGEGHSSSSWCTEHFFDTCRCVGVG